MSRYLFGSILISCFVIVLSDLAYDISICPIANCIQKIGAKEFYIYNATKMTSLTPIRSKVPQAKQITVRKCNLMSLNKEELNFRDLNVLHIINNRLSILKENTLSYLTSLQEINLSYNQVHSVSGKFFSGVTDLKLINFKNNSIGELPRNLFTNLTKLQHVDLSCNELIVIEEGVFENNRDLVYLNLINNKIKRFALSLPALHFLNLSNNQLQDLQVKSVNYLSVNHCSLKLLKILGSCHVLEASSNELAKIEIQDKKSIISILASKNVIQNFSDFFAMDSLQSLDLSKNSLNHEHFEGNGLRSLKRLNLQSFFIDSVDIREKFSEYDSLETLIVSSSLAELSVSTIFPSLTNLRTLTVYGENIRSVSKADDFKSIFPNLERFILKNHKLNYNQKVILKKQLIKFDIEFVDLYDEEQQNLHNNGIFDQIDNLTELTETSNNSNKYLLVTILLVLLLILLMNALTVLNLNINSCTRGRSTNIDHSFRDSTVSFLYNDESRI